MIAARKKPLVPVTSKRLDERRFEGVLSCGMKLVFAPRKGFKKKLAFVVAGYGSVDRAWEAGGKRFEVPDGIAHFLEHQLFKKAHGDLSDQFSQRGAYVNAQTSHTQTAFYFECVEQFEANLGTLMELALTPHFDKKLVDVERDIIIQEINQYRDQPGWVSFQQLLEALYVNHPLRVDIAGTQATVEKITAELLGLCHGTFYHPSNLTLIITADMTPAEVFNIAERQSAKFAPETPARNIKHKRYSEPDAPTRRRAERRMFVQRPRLLIGFKDTEGASGRDLLRREMETSLALDALFSRESEAYERLYRDGLIASDFGAAFQAETGYGYCVIGGETRDADALEEALVDALAQARDKGIDADTIERKRRKFLGRYLRNFNDPESTAYSYLGALGQRCDLFDFPEVLDAVTPQRVNARIAEFFSPSRCASSVLLPPK
ncbi:MAG: insulinase family protein [Planctomycetes bacterium]|nr:insulinase family protein [Planctomycetota bacterium]